MRCLIVDDEPLAHRVIKSYSEGLPQVQIVGSAHSAIEAMSLLGSMEVDLLFLDINMPKIQGLDFLKTLINPPMVIITTAYQEFALESYELRVIDYLLKPFSLERFLKAVNRAMEQVKPSGTKMVFSAEQTDSKTEDDQTLFIKSDKKIHQVRIEDILYLESYGSYVKVHLPVKTIITLERLANYESKLSGHGFIRIHKSFMVPVRKISEIEGNQVKVADVTLPIGAVYKHNIKDLLE